MTSIVSFYENLKDIHGTALPALGWPDEDSQSVRFEILTRICPLHGLTVLDVGCGFGDLYGYLKDRQIFCNYVGIDLMPSNIQEAKKRYPDGQFKCLDFKELPDTVDFDVVFGSGVLSINYPGCEEDYTQMIQKMFSISRIGCAFNKLDSKYHLPHPDFVTSTVPEMFEICSNITERMLIRRDYFPHDFTIYLYHYGS